MRVRRSRNQVKVFTPAGNCLRAIGRPGGRRLLGPWQRDGMAFAQGIAVDSAGQLWVTEADMSPKRISVWDAGRPTSSASSSDPTTYGAAGRRRSTRGPAADGRQRLRMADRSDYRPAPAARALTRDGMSEPAFRRRRATARLYLAVASGWAFGAPDVRIFERVRRLDYRLRAMFSYEGRGQTAKTVLGRRERRRPRQPGEITASTARFTSAAGT